MERASSLPSVSTPAPAIDNTPAEPEDVKPVIGSQGLVMIGNQCLGTTGSDTVYRFQQVSPTPIMYSGRYHVVNLSDSPEPIMGAVPYRIIPLPQRPGSSMDNRPQAGPSSAIENGVQSSVAPASASTSGSGDILEPESREEETTLPIHFRVFEVKNKFQTYNPQFMDLLKTPKGKRRDKIHDFQREAVLNAKFMADMDNPNDPLRPIVIVAPPGSGKTGMVVMLPYAIASKSAMILTPSPILSTQIAESFGLFRDRKSFFEVAGIWSPEQLKDLLEPVRLVTGKLQLNERSGSGCVIINAQKFTGQSSATLNPKYAKGDGVRLVEEFIERSDLIIVDEAHHYPAKTWTRIIEVAKLAQEKDKKKRTVIFLSATFEKKDKTPIVSDMENRIAYTVTLDQLEGKVVRSLRFEEEGTLNDPDFTNPDTFATVAEDIRKNLASQKKAEPRFIHQAMVIVRTRNEAAAWTNGMNAVVNDPSFAIKITGERISQKLTDDFSAGKYQVAVICNLLKEGYSNPKVSLCVILRNIGSRVLFDQFVGRCMRFNRDIKGKTPDRSVGIITSYTDFKQKQMWETRLQLAEHDPVVEEEEAEEVPVPVERKRKARAEGRRSQQNRRRRN